MAVGQLHEPWLGSGLFRRAVAHQLDVEAVRESRREFGERGFGGLGLPFRKQPPDRSLWTPCEAEKPLAGAGQLMLADRRLAGRFSRQIRLAHQSEQVSVPRLVLNQKHDPVRFRYGAAEPINPFGAGSLQRDLAT